MFTASLALDEVERVDGINRELGEINAAWRTAYAMNKPDELVRGEQAARRRMQLHAFEAGPVDTETVAQVLARWQKAQRIARRMKRKG